MDGLGYWQRQWEDPESTAFWTRDEYYGHDDGWDDDDADWDEE